MVSNQKRTKTKKIKLLYENQTLINYRITTKNISTYITKLAIFSERHLCFRFSEIVHRTDLIHWIPKGGHPFVHISSLLLHTHIYGICNKVGIHIPITTPHKSNKFCELIM